MQNDDVIDLLRKNIEAAKLHIAYLEKEKRQLIGIIIAISIVIISVISSGVFTIQAMQKEYDKQQKMMKKSVTHDNLPLRLVMAKKEPAKEKNN